METFVKAGAPHSVNIKHTTQDSIQKALNTEVVAVSRLASVVPTDNAGPRAVYRTTHRGTAGDCGAHEVRQLPVRH